MGTERTPSWRPDWAVPPGEILLEVLQERFMTQSELARRIDRPLKTVNEIIKGKTAITPDTAIQLERALGISASMWNGLEAHYREHLAREKAEAELARETPWLDRLPLKDLFRYGVVKRGKTKTETLSEVLSFFGVSSPAAWNRQWTEPVASFRSSPAFIASPEAVSAWLRWGEIEAERVASGSYNADRFRETLGTVRSMTTREPFAMVVESVREICAEAGVVLVLTPELQGTRLSGAARWLTSDRALIQLSLRHQMDDQFWFSFFHEAGHIIEGVRRRDVLDSLEGEAIDERERESELAADSFARQQLIPETSYVAFRNAADFSPVAIREFAKEIGIAAGIVVGRLQSDRIVEPSQFNSLKRSIRWSR